MSGLYTVIVIILVLAAIYLVRRMLVRRMSREQFMEAVKAHIEANYPGITVKEPLEFGWKVEVNGAETSLFLENAYAVYWQQPRLLNRIIDDFVANLTQVEADAEADWEDAKHRLFPSIKPQEYAESLSKISKDESLLDIIAMYDYKPGLKIMLVLDSPRTMRSVKWEEIEKWGITREQALEIALQNLTAKTAPLWPDIVEQAKKNFFVKFDTEDGYDASRILLPDFYERASRAIGVERLAVAIPTRDLLMAFDADHFGTEKHIQMLNALYSQGHHSISPEIYHFPEG